MATLDPEVLGRILVFNNLLHAAPNEGWLGEVAANSFAGVPSVDSVAIYRGDQLLAASVPKHSAPAAWPSSWPVAAGHFTPPCKSLTIQTARQAYGHVVFRLTDEEQFLPYLPFIENTVNTIALVMETSQQQKSLEALTRNLEQEVAAKVAELVDKESHYRILVESTNAVPWELDLATMRFTYIGPQIVDMLGYPLDSWAGFKEWQDKLHPDDRDAAVNFCRQSTAQLQDHDFVYRAVRSDGSVCWIHDLVTVLKGEGGPTKLVGFMIDVTEQKAGEERLLEINLRHREVVRAANVGLWDWDLAADRVSFSVEWKSQIGYLEHEISDGSEEWRSRLHPDDLNATLEAVEQSLVNEQQGYKAEFRFRHRDGSYRWILAQGSVFRNESGQPVRMLGSHVDITERKQAEEALRLSEERFSRAFYGGPLMMALSDFETGTYIEVNDVFCRVSGFSREEAVGRTSLELGWIEPEERKKLVDEIKAKGRASGLELRLTNREGNTVWCDFSGEVIPMRNGKFLMSIAQDITARKHIEETLRASEHYLRMAVEGGEVGLWKWDVASGQLEWNARLKGMFGISEGTVGLTLDRFVSAVHPEDVELTTALFTRALREGTMFRHEYRIIRPDGSIRWIVAIGRGDYDADGRAVSMVGAALEITDRKQADERLRKNQEELLASQKVAGLGTYRWSIVGGQFECSEVMNSIFGISADYPHSYEGWKRLIHPDDRQMMADYLVKEVMGKRSRFDKEYRIVRASDREERWVHGLGEILCDETGNPQELFGTIQDITERKLEYHQSIRSAQLAAIGELAAGVAHEINNPITGVINCAQLLISRQAVQAKDLEIAERIVKEGGRVAAIVRELLFLARDSGNQRAKICVQELMDQVLSLCRSQLEKSGISLEACFPESPVYVAANAQQLEQVLLNLISNSRYALNEKNWANDDEKKILIAVETRGAAGQWYCYFDVLDNGTGISTQLMNKIGKPFVTTKPSGVGTGLGLSISQEIVRNHGGEWLMESEEGKYTRVSFGLPLAESIQ